MIDIEAIQEHSYLIWEREGRPHGRDLDHWLEAEAKLRSELPHESKTVRLKRASAAASGSDSATKGGKAKTKNVKPALENVKPAAKSAKSAARKRPAPGGV